MSPAFAQGKYRLARRRLRVHYACAPSTSRRNTFDRPNPMSRPLVVIFACVALDAAGIALIFPILPNLLRSMAGVDDVSGLFGAMLALYAFMQFVFTPVLGVLSDRFGRRPVLLLSLAGSTIDYLVMAFTPYLWLLFAGRAIAGL